MSMVCVVVVVHIVSCSYSVYVGKSFTMVA